MTSHSLPESKKKQFFQVGLIRVRPVHSLKVFQFIFDVCHRTLYSKFEIMLQQEESAVKPNVSRKTPFIL